MTSNYDNQELVASEIKKKDNSTSFGRLIWREIRHDKMALFSTVLLALILIAVYASSLFLDIDKVARVDIFNIYAAPNAEHLLGTDEGGRDVLSYLMIGAKNSINIGVLVTLIAALIGLTFGIVAGYFGGVVDNVIMRFIDFMIILPFLMIIIVIVSILPNYRVIDFVLVMSLFYWTGKARLIRSKALAERELDYINASKTLGTPNWKIIIFQLLPNLSSIIIVNMTLALAGNIGIETGLTYLGFGLPASTPSLGTLISYASSPDVIENKWWVWLPASLAILVIMLCINFIGQALKRAADSRQRLA